MAWSLVDGPPPSLDTSLENVLHSLAARSELVPHGPFLPERAGAASTAFRRESAGAWLLLSPGVLLSLLGCLSRPLQQQHSPEAPSQFVASGGGEPLPTARIPTGCPGSSRVLRAQLSSGLPSFPWLLQNTQDQQFERWKHLFWVYYTVSICSQ